MSGCADKELLLHGLLDGELDAANTLACESHLGECPACAEEFRRLQALRSKLRTPGVAFQAPAALRERVVAELAAARGSGPARDTRRTPAQRWSRRPAAWAWVGSLAAVMAAVVLGVLFIRAPRPEIADELVASHIRSLLATHLVDVVTSDRHVVKPWFAGKVPFSPPVLELADRGFPLVGGRLDYVQGRVAAAIVYRHKQHIINVFVWPANAGPTVMTATRDDGYNLLGWSRGGLRFCAVSDVEAGELGLLRAAFEEQPAP
jgi:anti-sigma factor RsiW